MKFQHQTPINEETRDIVESVMKESKPKKPSDSTYGDLNQVVFKKECDIVIAGVQITRWDNGWKNSYGEFTPQGVFITVPGYKRQFVPITNIRQIEFKV